MTTTEEDEEPSSPASSSVNAQWIANVTLGWQEKLYSAKEETFYQKAKEEDFQVNWTQNVREYLMSLFFSFTGKCAEKEVFQRCARSQEKSQNSFTTHFYLLGWRTL